MDVRIRVGRILVLLLLLAEVLLLSSYRGYYGALRSPLTLFFCSLFIGMIGLSGDWSLPRTKRKSQLIYLLIPVIGAIFIWLKLSPIFAAAPLDFMDVTNSDVIPQIGFMVQRLLSGTFPYDPIPDWGVYVLNPTYLPLQWMPFTIAEISGIDYRWVPFGALSLAIFYFQFLISKSSMSALQKVALSVVPWLIWHYVINDEPKVMAYTIETLIAGYYFFLGLSLLGKNKYQLAFAISLCLLSRFSFVLWLPLFGVILLFQDSKNAVHIFLLVLAGVLIIYVIPFMSQDPQIFMNGMAHHTKAAVAEWAPYWQQPGEKPYHLYRGVGLAAFFYQWLDGEIIDRIRALQIWHISSIGISLVLLAIYYFIRKSKLSTPIFLVASLKIYFCFFYYFIQIPYVYLMIVPLFLSVVLLFAVWNSGVDEETI